MRCLTCLEKHNVPCASKVGTRVRDCYLERGGAERETVTGLWISGAVSPHQPAQRDILILAKHFLDKAFPATPSSKQMNKSECLIAAMHANMNWANQMQLHRPLHTGPGPPGELDQVWPNRLTYLP